MGTALASLLFAAIVLANAWASRAVLKDNLSTPGQRVAQLAFVWLVPLIGAALTLHFKRIDEEPSEGRYREIPNPGDDMVSSTHGSCIGRESIDTGSSGSAEGGSSD
jgi:hypothetical protein